MVLQDETYSQMAITNYTFILQHFKQDETGIGLLHTFKNGIAKYPAFLEDYAYFIEACIHLYEIGLDGSYLEIAKKYCELVIENCARSLAFFSAKA